MKRRKVLFFAPIVEKRFKGGIMNFAQQIKEYKSFPDDLELFFFNPVFIDRGPKSAGRISILNFADAFILFIRVIYTIRRKNIDIVHINTSSKIPFLRDALLSFVLTVFFRVKVFLHIHMTEVKQVFPTNFEGICRCLTSKCVVVCLSEQFKKELSVLGFQNLTVLYNFHSFNFSTKSMDSRIQSVPHDILRLIFLGNIEPRKGVLELVMWLKSIKLDFVFMIAGAGDSNTKYHQDFMDVIDNDNKFLFLGYLDKESKSEALFKSDILILNSSSEGFPMVVPEALSHGCIVLSTGVGAIPEIICNGENGYIYNNVDEFTLRLNQLRDTLRLKEMKKTAYETSRSLSIDSFVGKLIEIYRDGI